MPVPQRVEAVFEVNTDLQKNVQAKVTAQLTWPSVVNSSQHVLFPLTNTNGSSVSTNNPVPVSEHMRGYFKASLRFANPPPPRPAGGGGHPAESRRRSRLRPSSAAGPDAQPLGVFGKAGRQVRRRRRRRGHRPAFRSLPLFLTPISFRFPRLPSGNLSNINIDANTLEFQVRRNQVSAASASPRHQPGVPENQHA